MEDKEYQMLESLLRKFRDDSVDREEFDKRESVRFDVAFECQIRGINLLSNAEAQQPAVAGTLPPWKGKLHHSRKPGDDWGRIRDEDGDLIICLVLPTDDENELAKHRRKKTDPTQERVDYIVNILNQRNAGRQPER
jgi:hypothetical protein